jgi:hypothetical protein
MRTAEHYNTIAEQLGNAYITEGCIPNLNDRVYAKAAEFGYNQEEIRTVMRMANTVAFESAFAKKAASGDADRMVDFEVGNPEIVIQRLFKEAEQKSEPLNSSAYNQITDLFSDIPKQTEDIKVASDTSPVTEPTVTYNAQALPLLLKSACDKLSDHCKLAEVSWAELIEDAIQTAKVNLNTYDKLASFETNALASLGETITPELIAIRRGLGCNHEDLSATKVANILNSIVGNDTKLDLSLLSLVKQASKHREDYTKLKKALGYIETQGK